jgi:hypothetical protein
MNKVVTILSEGTVGATFLDWSLHYLAGHNSIYSGKGAEFGRRQLSSNPLTHNNAHGHVKNHAEGFNNTIDTMRVLESINTSNFHSMYSYFLLGSTPEILLDHENLWNTLCAYSKHTIFLVLPNNNKFQLYADLVESRTTSGSAPVFQVDSNTWDQRETMALNKRPFIGVKYNLDLSKPHIYINPMDLFNTFDTSVCDILNTLGIDINLNRIDNWKLVYIQWKKIHYFRMQWVFYFDQIMDYIINDYSMDLTRFDLDINQEATIQHVLIYKYGLNLKTWGLEKFPNNTQQLHKLLEENIHTIEKYNMPI